MSAWSLEIFLATAERNDTIALIWAIAVAAGVIGILTGVAILLFGGAAVGDLSISIGPIKAGKLGLGGFILVLGAAAVAPSLDRLVTELGKSPPARCDQTGVAGEVDPAEERRQPGRGNACINADEVAMFFNGQLRVTLRDFNDRRIGSAVLETTGDETPIHTSCPFVWEPGLAAGDTMRLEYRPAPEDAAREESLEWVVSVEQVLADSARVVAMRSAFTFAGEALRKLRRTATKGRIDVNCGSSSANLVSPGERR